MIAIRRILCPIDFSDFADRAFRHACRLARWYGAEIHALHVTPLMTEAAWAVSFPIDPHTHEPRVPADFRRHLESRFADARAEGIAIETHVREGGAAHEIVRYAEEAGVDLIVMGTHGRNGLRRLVLGSVADTVLRRSPCPVLTVCRTEVSGDPAGPPFRRIVCAVDFEPSSEPTLMLAISLATEAAAHLTLLHVVEPFFQDVFAERTHVSVEEYERFLKAQLQARLAQAIPAAGLEVLDWHRPHQEVRIGKPAVEIVRGAHDARADLLVMGLHGGRRAVDRLVFGSTAQEVIRRADCPVLTPRTPLRKPTGHEALAAARTDRN
jgi:nucleotide-binding universal stress UspA family protein